MTGIGVQSVLAVFVVLAFVAALAWLARRGAFNVLGQSNRSIVVETAVPLGERRSLVVVAVEGRRLLLGLTPSQISMVTELGPVAPPSTDGRPASFDQHLLARARNAFSQRQSAVAAREAVSSPSCG